MADSFNIRTLYLGQYPPRITGIKIHDNNSGSKEDIVSGKVFIPKNDYYLQLFERYQEYGIVLN